MITAWEVRSMQHRLSVENALRSALQAATALNEPDFDVGPVVLRIAQHVSEPKDKALLLGKAARILTDAGRTDDAITMLLAALDASKLAGRDTVMEVLVDGAMTLASIDNGELLLRLCRELEAIDDWFVDDVQLPRS